jgi:hypothetical protein
LDEQTSRYNSRKDINDSDRFDLAVRQIVGKRLTWDRLTGKEEGLSTLTAQSIDGRIAERKVYD